jgi:IMP dehydrogenase
MDGAVDVRVAIELSRLGALGVMNGEGLQTRYEDAEGAIAEIIAEPVETVVPLIQKMYRTPVKAELIAKRVEQIKAGGGRAVLSFTPSRLTKREYRYRSRRGRDCDRHDGDDADFAPASTLRLITEILPRIESSGHRRQTRDISGVLQLMEAGAACVLIGVGPGAACTTRRVLGLGVPQATAIADSAQARDDFFAQSGKYIPIIADGGLRTGGDRVQSDCVRRRRCDDGPTDCEFFGSAGTRASLGHGDQFGELPRGTRVKVGQKASLEQILFGPATKDDGTLNFVGALKLGMGSCGAATMKEMQQVRF